MLAYPAGCPWVGLAPRPLERADQDGNLALGRHCHPVLGRGADWLGFGAVKTFSEAESEKNSGGSLAIQTDNGEVPNALLVCVQL